jgi:hypothetical protein
MVDEARRPTLTGLELGDPAEPWEALGFTVVEETIALGGVRLALGAARPGISRWWLAGIDPADDIDGLPTTAGAWRAPEPVSHLNGATELDHVVITTPDFDRTAAALAAHGLPLRRIRDAGGFRQGFRRLGPGILELVEASQMPAGPARFWGLVIILSDLGRLAGHLGAAGLVGEVKPAVQPGRQIVTLKRAAGLGQPVAFMSPDPG